MTSYESAMSFTVQQLQNIENYFLENVKVRKIKYIKMKIEDVDGFELETIYYGKESANLPHHKLEVFI